MRVLMYCRVDPCVAGGVQRVVTRVARALREHGHEVVHFSRLERPPHLDPGEVIHLPRLVRRRGVPDPRSLLGCTRALARLARRLAVFRPDVVNVHFATAEAVYFALLKALFGYRLVVSVHGSDVLRPKPPDAPVLGYVLRRASAVTTVSSVTATAVRRLLRRGRVPVIIIPNGIDYQYWSREIATAAPATTLLGVGRLHPVKGFDLLLRALPHVRRRVGSARVTLIGDGPERAALERLAGDLDVADAVEFAGELDASGVRRRLQDAAAFVLPSRSEGLPLALLEAMAASVPPIAADVGGVPDVLAPGAGLLVPPEDPEALAAAIAEVLLDERLRAGLAAGAHRRARLFTAARADAGYERALSGRTV